MGLNYVRLAAPRGRLGLASRVASFHLDEALSVILERRGALSLCAYCLAASPRSVTSAVTGLTELTGTKSLVSLHVAAVSCSDTHSALHTNLDLLFCVVYNSSVQRKCLAVTVALQWYR